VNTQNTWQNVIAQFKKRVEKEKNDPYVMPAVGYVIAPPPIVPWDFSPSGGSAQPTTPTCTCQTNSSKGGTPGYIGVVGIGNVPLVPSSSSKGVTRMNPVFRPVTTGPLHTSNPFGRRISPVLKLTPSQTAILIAWEQKAPGIVAQALKLVPPPTVGHGSSGGGGWFDDFLGTITSLGKTYLNYRASEDQLSAQQAQQQLQQQLSAYNISLAGSGSGLGGISTTTLLIGGAVVLGAVVLMGKKKRK
jgi:hypothetical protein